MAKITEIAPDLFQITTFVEPFNIQFSQFLLRDNQPLLFHTGPRALFPEVKAAVASLIEPQTLRWIGFSHFESDECATVPEWQQLTPHSEVLCSLVGKMVSVDDYLALRPARGMVDERVSNLGRVLLCNIALVEVSTIGSRLDILDIRERVFITRVSITDWRMSIGKK
jgi:hypothetical protein